jgi:hypothetical protein
MTIRRHVRFLSYLALSVALLFGIRELPELMSLADDVSNDGEVIEFAAPDESSVQTSESHRGEFSAHAIRSREVARSWLCLLPRTLPLRSGKSLLQLLSLLRV